MIYILIISIAISLILGKVTISSFKKKQIKQTEREDGPESHFEKAGTPTMGGVFVISTVVLTYLILFIFKVPIFLENIASITTLMLFSLAFGLIGFYDDYLKVNQKGTEGLDAKGKMLALIFLSIVFVIVEVFLLNNPTTIIIPFLEIQIPLNIFVYIGLSIAVLLSTPNAINLTDGIDGLAASVGITILTYFALVALLDNRIDVAIFAILNIGAYLGFLVYNWHKAKIFMGDTGSFFLGGLIGLISIALGKPLYLFFIAVIPVIETLSVILQVAYFKKTGGKRIFKMTPYHHHLELSGWKEIHIVLVFSAITAVIGLALLLAKVLV